MSLLRTALVWLSALVVALCLGVSPALTRTIINTAQASWLRGQTAFAVKSNTVVIETVPEPARFEILVAAPQGQMVSFMAPACGQAVEPGGGAQGTPIQAKVTPATEIHAGELLYFRIVAPSANADPVAIDSLRTTFSSPSGDREEVRTYETAANSGEFVGFVQTAAPQAQPLGGDCVLSVEDRQQVALQASLPGSTAVIAASQVSVLTDPFGLVIDSETGAPINGARITLLDAATGLPASVLADDGITSWPATIISGQAVTDGAGRAYRLEPGEYRFPLVAPGRYRLAIEPPPNFSAPSGASPEQLSLLRRPDGLGLNISSASTGAEFSVDGPAPLRVDIPLDPRVTALSIIKTASRQDALPGDAVVYSIVLRNNDPSYAMRGVRLSDTASSALRLGRGSIKVDGQAGLADLVIAPDGNSFSVGLGTLLPGESRSVTYVMSVRSDASPGTVMNEAQATDARGRTSKAAVHLRILQEDLASRMTLIGRVTAGSCLGDGSPVSGVRIMLEDGSFAITDSDGRYHFPGLEPGSHVVRAVPATLPEGSRLRDCARGVRSADNAQSRFITGQGGSLAVADFAVIAPQEARASPPSVTDPLKADPADERKAAGADVDWLAVGNGPAEFLFPAIDYNPRVPATRVVIRHRADQTVNLKANGRPVDRVAFDGTNQAPGGQYAVSIWRGVPLGTGSTHFEAEVLGPRGGVVSVLSRDVHFSFGPARIELVEGQSRLVADGQNRPVLALRILDRNGRPVRAGSTGEFRLSAPYESAEVMDAAQQNSAAGQARGSPRWFVRRDDGMAYVELAPTMISGKLSAQFNLADGSRERKTDIEAWLLPGDQPWTVVGLAEGAAGSRSIADAMQHRGKFSSALGQNGRIALYAKGSVTRDVLLTAAYDSARQRDEKNLGGQIDPRAYYSVFADLSARRFDAASRDRGYARIEGKGFYATYGDVDGGFDQTKLAHYLRSATGLKGGLNRGALQVQGFAARIGSRHGHDEFQGGGISGPYRLGSRGMVPGSESVAIEIRDRFRPEIVLSSRILTRFVDYDLDLLSGTITFREPLQSRDVDLNPRFVVIDYEVADGVRSGDLNGGLRGSLSLARGALKLGASMISDRAGQGTDRSNLVSFDVKAALGAQTELRGELGKSFTGSTRDTAWLLEAEHHEGKLDLLAYARSATRFFGIAQQKTLEGDWRKLGVDLNYRLTDRVALIVNSWRADSLGDQAHRSAVQVGGHWQGEHADLRLGLAAMRDHLADGRSMQSTVVEGGVTRRLLDNRLELSTSSSLALGKANSVDLPVRHRFGARYAVTSDVRLIGSYEVATGEGVNARSAQAGVELTPWSGADFKATLGQQLTGELPSRRYAAFGVTQSIPVTAKLAVTATLDSNRTLSLDGSRILNPRHPASSGGFLDGTGSVSEDFTAATLGANWRSGLWSATMRGEWRNGELESRKGVMLGAIRQMGEGSMAGAAFTWTRGRSTAGAFTQVIDGALSLAHRPAASSLALLAKLEFRSDRADGAGSGNIARPASGLAILGDGHSQRLIASLSGAWTPDGKEGGQSIGQSELGFFAAVRQNLDRFGGYDLGGTSLLGGLDLRFGLGTRIDLGVTGTLRANLKDRTASYAVGPQVGITPAKDVLLAIGYNLSGFHDPDFTAARSTEKGPFVSLRMKFDETILDRVGLRIR